MLKLNAYRNVYICICICHYLYSYRTLLDTDTDNNPFISDRNNICFISKTNVDILNGYQSFQKNLTTLPTRNTATSHNIQTIIATPNWAVTNTDASAPPLTLPHEMRLATQPRLLKLIFRTYPV